MLILIKGRRHCSLRLVNPIFESMNEGDCYLLITPSKVFAWLGQYANALEKAKTMDLIDYLKQHRDFGLRSEVKYFVLDQANDDTENDIHAEFADILHGEDDNFKTVDCVTDDDYYEANIMELNRVYRLDNDMLIPLDDFCFHSLSVKILDSNDVFVFDFGSELYVWNGKYADKTKRNIGLQLAQQLWNDSYDFSECLINPFDPFDGKKMKRDAS
jgi:supervillin